MISLIVVSLGAVAAALGTGVLTARTARAPRLFLAAWTVALFGLTISLGAQALGDVSGYSELTFRAMELGGQAIAPLALCLGLTELAGKSVAARFAMRLVVSALGVIMLVILGTDPLNPSASLSSSWPDPSVFYQPAPKGLIIIVGVLAICTAIGTGIAAMRRSGYPEWQESNRPALLVAAAAAVLFLPCLSIAVPLPLSHTYLFPLACVVAAAFIWYAARGAERAGLAEAGPVGTRDGSSGRYDDDFGRPGHGSFGSDPYHSGSDYDGRGYADDFGRGLRKSGDELSYPALAALAADPAERADGSGRRGDPDRYGEADRYGERDRRGGPDRYGDGGFEDSAPYDDRGGLDDRRSAWGDRHGGDPYGDLARTGGPGRARDGHDRPGYENGAGSLGGDPAQFFGQITIYTLLDDRTEDFDRLTERVVEQVREKEPGTLVYIVHAVPTAPMQRILYEVYQDRAAYEEHLSQPYVARYEAERRRLVLATNVIELGLQQAKVSPLPSYSAISEILSESGIDLTGVTKQPRSGTQATRVMRSPRGEVLAPSRDYPPDPPRRDYPPDPPERSYRPEPPGGRDYPSSDPRDLPPPDPDRYGSSARPGGPGYEGWQEIRRDDPRYR